jgi:hypothetical protein
VTSTCIIVCDVTDNNSSHGECCDVSNVMKQCWIRRMFSVKRLYQTDSVIKVQPQFRIKFKGGKILSRICNKEMSFLIIWHTGSRIITKKDVKLFPFTIKVAQSLCELSRDSSWLLWSTSTLLRQMLLSYKAYGSQISQFLSVCLL